MSEQKVDDTRNLVVQRVEADNVIADKLEINDDRTVKLLEQQQSIEIATTEAMANRIVESNEMLGDKLLGSDAITAKKLQEHNEKSELIAATRFAKQRWLSSLNIVLSVLTFLVLIAFTIAFFNYAIIVRT